MGKFDPTQFVKTVFAGIRDIIRAISEHSMVLGKTVVMVCVAFGMTKVVNLGVIQKAPFFEVAVFLIVFLVAVMGMFSAARKLDRRR